MCSYLIGLHNFISYAASLACAQLNLIAGAFPFLGKLIFLEMTHLLSHTTFIPSPTDIGSISKMLAIILNYAIREIYSKFDVLYLGWVKISLSRPLPMLS